MIKILRRFGWGDKLLLLVLLFAGFYHLFAGDWFSYHWWLGISILWNSLLLLHLLWAVVIVEDQKYLLNTAGRILESLHKDAQSTLEEVKEPFRPV
jgi:hypothetical protein